MMKNLVRAIAWMPLLDEEEEEEREVAVIECSTGKNAFRILISISARFMRLSTNCSQLKQKSIYFPKLNRNKCFVAVWYHPP